MTEAALTSIAFEVEPKADQDRTRTMSAVVAFQRLKDLLPPTMLVEVQEHAEERTSGGGRR
jgi:hypothetical protein